MKKDALTCKDWSCLEAVHAQNQEHLSGVELYLVVSTVRVDQTAAGVVSRAGAVVLIDTIRRAGLDRALSAGLAAWRPRLASHDPAKVLLDLAVSTALGGDCLADAALVRAEPGVFGLVASDPTVSRIIDRPAVAKETP